MICKFPNQWHVSLFTELKISKLHVDKDKIKGILTEEYDGLIYAFKGMRDRLLKDSDYTQMPDYPSSADVKALWAT